MAEIFPPPARPAASTVVTTITEAAIQAAITKGGSIAVVGTGTLELIGGWDLPDKDVSITLDPRITFDLAAHSVRVFKVPAATLTARRKYVINNLRVTGGNTNSQYIVHFDDAGGLAEIFIQYYYFTGMKRVVWFEDGDTANYLQAARVVFSDGKNLPPSGAANPGLESTTAADSYSFPAEMKLIRSDWTDHANPTRGYIFNVDFDISLQDSKFSLADGTSKCDGLTAINSTIQGATDESTCILECNYKSVATDFSEPCMVAGLTLQKCQPHFMREAYILDGIHLDLQASISLRANGLCCRNLANLDASHTQPTRYVEITGDDCSLVDCRFRMSNAGIVAAVRNYGLRVRGLGLTFSTSGGTPKTWDDVNPGTGDFTQLDGCVGLGVGAGPVLGTNSRVDGVHVGNTAATVPQAHGVGRLTTNTTAVGNVGGGTDDLMTYAIPANALDIVGRTIEVLCKGRTANNATGKTITFVVGSQTVLTTALTASIVGQWEVLVTIVKTGTDTQDISARTLQGATLIFDQEFTAGTQDDGAAITVKMTGAAGANDDIVQELMIVKVS